jgi:hypothetical protein
MADDVTLLLVLDLTGTFAFALNGAMTALRAARLDLVGVVTLGMITALGGGIIRDVILDGARPRPFSTGAIWPSPPPMVSLPSRSATGSYARQVPSRCSTRSG